MVNSGCTSHAIFNKNNFITYHPFSKLGHTSTAKKSHNIAILEHVTILLQTSKISNLFLQDVLYISKTSEQFLASCKAIKMRHQIAINKNSLIFHQQKTNIPLFFVKYDSIDRLYQLKAKIMKKVPYKEGTFMLSTSMSTIFDYDL